MEKVSTEKQLEILDAALGLFSKKGFERTTVDEIASHAGVGKGTVYLYFSNKEQIFLAIIERGLTDLQSLYTKISPTQDFYRQFHDIIYINLEYVEQHQDFYRIFIKERLNLKLLHDEHTKGMLMEKHAQLHESLVGFMQIGIDRGLLRSGDPHDYSIALSGVLNHFIMHWLWQGTSESLTAKTGSILDIIISGIKQCS